MSLNQVNIAVVENNTIVKSDVLRAEKAGSAVKIKAVKGGKYILAQGEKGYAPENITVKRVGKNLHVMLEGTDESQPQLIIEDFFENPGELVGKAEDGQWHEFISSDGDSDHEAAFLMDGESSALVLGAGAIAGLDGLAVAPFALSPALLALGTLAGLLAAAGLAKAIANHNKEDGNGGSGGGSEGGEGGGGSTVFTPGLTDVNDNQGDFTGPIQNGGLTDDSTPTFSGTGTPGNIVVIRDNGEEIGTVIVGEDGKWEFTPENPLEDGEHKFELVERDDKGNESAPSDEFIVIIDTEAPARPDIGQVYDDVEPKMGPVANGGYTNDETPTLSGSGQTPGDTIIIIDNGKEIGSVIVGQDGSWSFTPEPLEDGDHNFEIVARDPAGNRSEPSEPWLVIVDTEIPGKPGTGTTPGLDDIIDDVGPVTGSLPNGSITDDTKPTLEGSHQRPGTIVTIIENGTVIGSVVADKNGGWQFTPAEELESGDHNFSIIIETPTGYISPESDPWLVIVDIDPPAAPVITGIIDDQGDFTGPIRNGDTTDDAQPEIRGTAEAGSTVIIYDKGVEIGRTEADASGNWTFIPVPPLLNGDHEITAKAQDKAGNIGDESSSVGFELIAGGNATAPAITGAWDDVEAYTGMLHNGDLTNDARPELRGTAQAGETVTIILDGKAQGTVIADQNGQWSWTPAADLSEGTHNFRAEVTDAAGNTTATGNFQLKLDLTRPDAADDAKAEDNVGPVTGTINPGDSTDDSTPTFGGTGEPGDKVIVKDGDDEIGTTIVGEDGKWEFTPENPLEDGEHSIIVIIEDPAGNQSDDSTPIEFIVDTGNVVVSINYAVDDVEAHTGNMASGAVTNDDTPTLHGKATPNSVVEIFDGTTSLGTVKTDSFGRWSFITPELQDGEHRFTATATDAKTGAISAPTAEFVLDIDTTAPTKPGEGGTGGDGIADIIDDVGPDQGSVGHGDVTDDTTPTLIGSGLQPGDVVTIIDNGQPIGSVVADENGGWQFTPDTPLLDGDHEFTTIVTDPAGNSSEESDPYLIVIDTEAPAAPQITGVIDDQGLETGTIANGGTTDDAQPEIRGTAEAGSTVIIYDKGVEIGRTEADASGDWTFTPVPPLLNGNHELSAKAQDKAGNIGDESNKVGFDLIAGGNASAVAILGAWDDVEGNTGMLHNGDLTNDARPELRGTAQPGEIVTIIMDGKVQGSATADTNGHWSWTPAADLSEGKHNFRAEVTDAAGNKTASGNFQLELDLTRPDAADDLTAEDNVGLVTGTINPGDTTDDSTPTFGGTGEPGDKVIVKDGDDVIGTTIVGEDGSWEFTPVPPLEDGEHSIIVIIEDPAGNQSDDSTPIEFIVDTGNVVVSINYAVDDVEAHTGNMASGAVTNDDTPTLVGQAKPNSMVEIFDGTTSLGTVKANAFGDWSFTPSTALAHGVHHFTAVATDAAGNVSAPTAEFVLDIDTTAPTKPGEGGTGGDGIADIIDDVGPDQGSVGHGDVTDDTTPTLIGSGLQPGDVVTIIDNGQPIGSVVADENGGWQFTPDTPLLDGDHEFTTIVTDPAGNSSEESDPYLIIVDTEAPNAPVIVDAWDDVAGGVFNGVISNGGSTNDNQPELRGTAEANSIVTVYKADGSVIGSTKTNAGGHWSFTPASALVDGLNILYAKAMDTAGNVSPQSSTFTLNVDTVAPNAPVISGAWDDVAGGVFNGLVSNNGLTNDDRPELRGKAEAGSVVTLYKADGSPLGSVKADGAGNWSWTPAAALAQGVNSFYVKATDAAGNTSPQSSTFTLNVDSVAPNAPVITEAWDDVAGGVFNGAVAHNGLTNDDRPELRGKAEADSVVTLYKADGSPLGSVKADGAGNWSWTPAAALAQGVNSFYVKATDAAGNISPQSSTFTLNVDSVAPNAPVISGAWDDVAGGVFNGLVSDNGMTNDDRPELRGKAEAGSVVTLYKADGSPLGSVKADGAGNWSWTPAAALAQGVNSFYVKATDAVGNTSPQSSTFTLNVDNLAPNAPVITSVVDNVAGGVVGPIANGGLTNDNKPTLSGTAEANSIVTIREGNTELGSVKVGADGKWSLELTNALTNGSHNLVVTATDAAGNTSPQSNSWNIVVDASPPPAPSITHIVDNFGPYHGNVSSGGETDDKTPTLVGRAESNSLVTIQIIVNGNWVVVGSSRVDAGGNWSWTPGNDLNYGSYSFIASAMDAAGNKSQLSSQFNLVIKDQPLLPPGIQFVDNFGTETGVISNGGASDDGLPDVKGTSPEGSIVYIIRDGGQRVLSFVTSASGKWTVQNMSAENGQAVVLSPGLHQYEIYYELNGHRSESTFFEYTVVPTPTIQFVDNFGTETGVISNGGASDDGLPDVKGTSPEGSIVYIIRDGGQRVLSFVTSASGKWTVQNMSAENGQAVVLSPGLHQYEIYYELNGHRSESTFFEYTVVPTPTIQFVDNSGTETGVISNGGASDDGLPDVKGTSPEGSIVYIIRDGGQRVLSFATSASGKWTVQNMSAENGQAVVLSPGLHQYEIYYELNGHRSESTFFEYTVVPNARSMRIENEGYQVLSGDEFVTNGELSLDESQPQYDINQHQLTVQFTEQQLEFSQLAESNVNVTLVDTTISENNVMNISMADIMAHDEGLGVTSDDTKQLMIKGNTGDVVNLTDLLPDGMDPVNWAKAEGTVTVGGVQYEVYQHSGADTELLVQLGVQTNLNNH